MRSRRDFLRLAGAVSASAAALALSALAADGPASPDAGPGDSLGRALAGLEAASGGRLGATLIDTADGRRSGHRQDERFPMCSTFKFLLAAAVLARHDGGRLDLERRVPIAASDLLAHSPATERHVGPRGMSVAGLCEATLTLSDNAAANLLLPLVGGPVGLTGYIRTLGDRFTRSDRTEPSLNEHAPGDPRDTTTPAAMAANLRMLLLGDALSPASRRCLTQWMVANRTGDARLRAGLPAGWRVGDKTGSDGRDTANDIAILWPPGGRPPLLLTAYLNGAQVDAKGRDATLAAVARAVAAFMHA